MVVSWSLYAFLDFLAAVNDAAPLSRSLYIVVRRYSKMALGVRDLLRAVKTARHMATLTFQQQELVNEQGPRSDKSIDAAGICVGWLRAGQKLQLSIILPVILFWQCVGCRKRWHPPAVRSRPCRALGKALRGIFSRTWQGVRTK